MAGLVNRLRRITLSRINAFLETVEEPEMIFPQLVREMKRGIGDAVKAESKAAAAVKADQRRLDESTGRSIRLAKGAELALRQGDESLAREALAEQVKADRLSKDQAHALQLSEAALLEARDLRVHLERQLEELKRRKKEIIARSRSAKRAAGTYRDTGKIRAAGAGILDEVSRMQQTEEANGKNPEPAGRPPGTFERSLEDRLRILEREAEIERRLNSIREKKQSTRTHSVPDRRILG
ncbi:MAG: PspA/IM30 family protein [Acidobacteria bacterium]|nr:PspA/IM30 family protein [Acidobacteriota bacterium]